MKYSSALRYGLCIAGVLWLGSCPGYGQRNPIFTQYMFNGLVVNPAYAGSHKAMTMTASVRSQWTKVEGAPQTQVFAAHAPIKFSRSAAGVVVMHDKAGVIGQSTLYGVYAYHIPVSANGRISVGAQAGLSYYQAKLGDVNVVTQNNMGDVAFAGTESRVMPNLGIGAYYYSKTTYIGLSLPTIINSSWKGVEQVRNESQLRHYYLTAGHVMDLSSTLKLKPNVLIRWVEGGPVQYDLNANLFIKRVLWVGVSYRLQDSVDALFEWNINDQLSFGYSYGYPVSALAAVQWGTHEVVLNYRLKKDKHIIRSPRYF